MITIYLMEVSFTNRSVVVAVREMFLEVHNGVHEKWHSLLQNLRKKQRIFINNKKCSDLRTDRKKLQRYLNHYYLVQK